MLIKRSFIVGLVAALGTSAFAAPTLLGTISLDYVAQAPGGEGTFLWNIQGSSQQIVTYCFSTSDYFSPSENPQVFNVWSIAGASAADVDSSHMLDGNHHSGLTAEHFLEAAAQAASFGPNPGIAQVDANNNAAVHHTESFGDGSFPSIGVGNFFYLEEANPQGYGYHGQPQGFVGNNPPPGTPEPASMAAIGVGLVGLIRRRRR